MNEGTDKGILINHEQLWWDLIDVDNCIDEEKLNEVREKVVECRGASDEELKDIEDKIHAALIGKLQSDLPWKELLDDIINKFPGTPQNSKAFLFVVKYIRAVLLSVPEKPNISDRMDDLVTCLVTNLHLAGSDPILRLFYLLECAFCAAGDVSRGFVSMARSTYFELDNVPELNGVIRKLWPVKSLLHYNEGLALTHMGHRKDAGKSYALAIKSFWEDLEEMEKSEGQLKDGEKYNIFNYIIIPTFLARADLLSKMQFSVNSIQTIRRLKSDLAEKSDKKIKLDDMKYRNTRSKLLEALAWFDVGEIKLGKSKLSDCLEDGQEWLNNDTVPSKDEIKKYLQGDGKNRRSLTLSCYLQYKIENLKNFIIESLPKSESKDKAGECLCKLESICDVLSVFLEVYQEDRFTRQNLKELYIDLLEIVNLDLFQLVKRGKDPESEDRKTTRINNAIKLNRIIKTILDGLNVGPDCVGVSVWLQRGSLANELWTGDYKNFAPDTRQRLAKIFNDLVEEYTDFYKNEKDGRADFKDVFCEAIENELFVLGVGEKSGNLVFAPDLANDLAPNENDGLKRFKEKFPKKNTYEYRKNLRRAIYVQELKKRVKSNEDLDFQYTWLKEEIPKKRRKMFTARSPQKPKGIDEGCLINLAESWRVEVESSTKTSASKASDIGSTAIPLKDYPKIIGESEIAKMFGHRKSRHPVNRQEDQTGETKKDGSAGFQFVCLRRWNSFTPEMSYSVGGGYFLFCPDKSSDEVEKDHYRKTKIGIVVDPGFDFLHNFFRQGFTLDDIDIILITHSDSDHINDFRTIADLLMERQRRGKKEKREEDQRIFTIMPLNTHPLVKRHIQEEAYRRLYRDTIIVDIDREYDQKSLNNSHIFHNGGEKLEYSFEKDESKLQLLIQPVQASHDDHTDNDSYCFGYIISLEQDGKELATVGFTGDSQWYPQLAEHFEKCQFVCSHMGSILGDKPEMYLETKLNVGEWEALIRKKNHSYLPGQLLFLQQLRSRESEQNMVIALSEFGEEMKGGLRVDVCQRLNKAIGEGCWSDFCDENSRAKNKCRPRCKGTDKTKVIPADVGLRISIQKNHRVQVHCSLCDEFCDIEDVKIEAFGYEEALFYVCRACCRSKSQDVRWKKYTHLLEEGRPVRD